MQRPQNPGRARAGLFLVGSLLLALVAAGLVFRIIKKNQDQLAEAQKPADTVDIVVAARDLLVGMPISEDDVTVVQLVPGIVPDASTFSTLEDVVGRTPRERILASEPIRDERIARPDAGIGLNAIVQPGKRAMTVSTNTEDAVAGLLQPGNFVDIIVTIKPEDPTAATAKWVTDTILQSIRVLAVGGSLNDPLVKPTAEKKVVNTAEGKKVEVKKKDPKDTAARRLKPSITLEVTPDEAEKLALAVAQGDIYVVLRSDIDTMQYADSGIKTSATLLAMPTGPAVVRTPVVTSTATTPTGPSAVVIQGSSRTNVQFTDQGTSESGDKKRKEKR